MAEDLRFGELSELQSLIKASKFNQTDLAVSQFQVVGIYRFIVDPAFNGQTEIDTTRNIDGYDIVLSDRNHKQKVIIDSSLNNLIQSHELAVGTLVKLQKCSLHYDEADLSSETLVVVEELEICGSLPLKEEDVIKLKWWPETNLQQLETRPLATRRGYYVDMWSTAYVDSRSVLFQSVSEEEIDLDDNVDLSTIKEVYKKWKLFHSMKPSLLVRVLKVSRMLHYAKPTKSDKWPFQLHILIGDESGCCTAVLWNVLAVKYVNVLKEGTCMLLNNFTMKKSFHDSSRWNVDNDYGDLFEVDVNFNPHHPESIIQLINPSSIDSTLLPALQYNFITRDYMRSIPDGVLVDVIGYVQFVGRIERETMKNRFEGDGGSYWVSRWLYLTDHTSDRPIIIQLYKPNQVSVLENIKPGQVIICRHVRVLQSLHTLKHSRQPRYIYLSSSSETQISSYDVDRLEDMDERLIQEDTVSDFIDWCETTQLPVGTCGGYFVYPPFPTNLQTFKELIPDLEISNSSLWESLLSDMVYKQRRTIYIQALLAHVKFIYHRRDQHNSPIQGRKSKKSKRQKLSQEDEEITVNEDWELNENQYTHLGLTEENQTDEMFPFTYDTHQSNITQINLPSQQDNLSTSGTNTEYLTENYFEVTWVGLNSKVDISSKKICGELKERDSFSDVINRSVIPTLNYNGDYNYETVNSILENSCTLKNTRFLVVLDLYCNDFNHVEVMLNRAFAINS